LAKSKYRFPKLFVKGILKASYSRALQQYRWVQGYHDINRCMPCTDLLTKVEATGYARALSRSPVFLDSVQLNLSAAAKPAYDRAEVVPTYIFSVTTNGFVVPFMLEQLLLHIPGVALVGHTAKDQVYGAWRGNPDQLRCIAGELTSVNSFLWHLDRVGITDPSRFKLMFTSTHRLEQECGVVWDCCYMKPDWAANVRTFNTKTGRVLSTFEAVHYRKQKV